MFGADDEYEPYVIDGKGVKSQSPFVSNGGAVNFGALSFNAASQMASALAVMIAAVTVTMYWDYLLNKFIFIINKNQ